MVFSNSRPKYFWRQRSRFAKLQCDQHRLHLLLCRLHVQTYRWHFQERYTLRLWDSNPDPFYFFHTFPCFRILVAAHKRWAALRRNCWDSFGVNSFIFKKPEHFLRWKISKAWKTLFQRDEDEQSSVGEARENITDWMRGASKKFSLKSWHQLWIFPNVASANLYLSTPGIPINLIIKC